MDDVDEPLSGRGLVHIDVIKKLFHHPFNRYLDSGVLPTLLGCNEITYLLRTASLFCVACQEL